MENTTKEANIIGNGFFDMTTIKSELPCVTCNFMHMDLNPIATVTGDPKVLRTITLEDVPCKVVFKNHGLNAGQFACEYLIHEGFTKLNLYGFTSRFKMDLSSESDKHYPKNTSNISARIPLWNAIWDEMIAHYQTVEFNFIPT